MTDEAMLFAVGTLFVIIIIYWSLHHATSDKYPHKYKYERGFSYSMTDLEGIDAVLTTIEKDQKDTEALLEKIRQVPARSTSNHEKYEYVTAEIDATGPPQYSAKDAIRELKAIDHSLKQIETRPDNFDRAVVERARAFRIRYERAQEYLKNEWKREEDSSKA